MSKKQTVHSNRQTSYALDGRSATDHFPGIGRYVSNLATSLVPLLRDDEHLLILHNAQRTSPGQLPAQSEKVTLLDTAVSPFSLKQQWHIPRLLQQYEIACYHSPYFIMPYRLNIPTVLTLYDLIPQKYPQYVSLKARLLTHGLTRLAMRNSTHMIAISEATRKDFLAAYALDLNSVTAVPLAVDDRFKPQPATAVQAIAHKYNLPTQYVLYLGINKPHKNLLRLVQAWHLVQEQLAPPHKLVIAGAWDARYPEAKAYVADHNLDGIVYFAGPIADDDLPALYSGADLFVFPSVYEGFGLPVLEAMACGTAVTCSHTSSLPEVGGDAVLYFNPAEVSDIAKAITSLLNNPENYGQNGVQQAARFTWERTAQSTLDIYRNMAVRS